MTTEQLPPELKCLIFSFTIQTRDDSTAHPRADPTPLTLGAVCSTWRNAAWGCPFLWNSPSLCLQRDGDKASLQAEILEEWLARSGDLPLSIEVIQPTGLATRLIAPAIEEIFRTMDEYAERWEHLALRVATDAYSRFETGLHLPLLRSLVICPPTQRVRHDYSRLHIVDTPRLQSVVLDCEVTGLQYVMLQWSLPSRLTLRNLRIDECLHILKYAINIARLDIDGLTDKVIGGYHMPLQPILLPNLQHICIQNAYSRPMALILHQITIPNAIGLFIQGFKSSMFPTYLLGGLVLRSKCAFTTLSFNSVTIDEEDLIQLLPLFTSLMSFSLCMGPKVVFYGEDDPESTRTPLQGLTDRLLGVLDASAIRGTEVCLPRLTNFTYKGFRTFSWRALTKTMESRCFTVVPAVPSSAVDEPSSSLYGELQAGSQPSFAVQIYEDSVLQKDRNDWGDFEGCMERIAALREAGMRVEITLP